jgi:hypothetical protein
MRGLFVGRTNNAQTLETSSARTLPDVPLRYKIDRANLLWLQVSVRYRVAKHLHAR